jgi:hypothetical protein
MIRLRHQPSHEGRSNGPAGDPDRFAGSAAHPRPRRAPARWVEAAPPDSPSLSLTAIDRSTVGHIEYRHHIVRAPSSSRADGSSSKRRRPPSGAASSFPLEIRQRSYGERAGSRCICNLSRPTVWPLIPHPGGRPRNGAARWTSSRSSAIRRPTDLAVAPASSPVAPARTPGSSPTAGLHSSRRGHRPTARRRID